MFGVYRGNWDVIKDNMFKDLSITIFIIIFIIIIIHILGLITMSIGMSAGCYPILTTQQALITHKHTHTHTGSFLGFSFWSSSPTAELYRRSPSLETRPRRGTTPTSWCPAHVAAQRPPDTLAPVYRCTDQLQPLTDKRSE